METVDWTQQPEMKESNSLSWMRGQSWTPTNSYFIYMGSANRVSRIPNAILKVLEEVLGIVYRQKKNFRELCILSWYEK